MQPARESAIVRADAMAAPEIHVRATAALDDLYRRHVGDVYRYTYAVLGNHADAEDVTQTTFVNALRALERGEQPRDPSNWLLVIAHNIVRQRWRQAAARPTEVELDHDVAEASVEPDVELDELVRALQRIPPAQREALVMRELEGRSYREISELLGLSTAALETLLFRARRSLAEELENLVTCQSAELAISKRIDGRLSRKERRRLESHLDECAPCARLAETATRQRKAFKGLAVLPIPIGLALFKGAPAASAAALPTIGGGTAATGFGASGVGAGGAGAGAGGAAAGAGGMAAGGSLLGGTIAKVAAVVIAGTVATGVGYEGVKAVTSDEPQAPAPARSSGVTAGREAQSTRAIPAKAVVKRDTARPSIVQTAVPPAASQTVGTSGATGAFGSPQAAQEDVNGRRGGGKKEESPATDTPKGPRHTPSPGHGPYPTPPVAKPSTPPDTPAGPKTTPPAAPNEPSGDVGASASASAPSATAPATAEESSSTNSGVDESTPCPGAGTGPGNGNGCGLATGHDRKAAEGSTTAETPPASTESAASADISGNAGAAVEASPGASADAGQHAGKPDKS
jgi:RNA polymerase sigma factor (sigma-70 family)